MVPQTEEPHLSELAALRPLKGGDPWSLTQLDQFQVRHVKRDVGGVESKGCVVAKTAPSETKAREQQDGDQTKTLKINGKMKGNKKLFLIPVCF